jgi:hypothetical protein
MDFEQKPLRKAVLVRKNPKNGKTSCYHVNLGKYGDSYAIWCCWGSQRPSMLGDGISRKQLKFISDNMIKVLVTYYDFISKYQAKGYETVSC